MEASTSNDADGPSVPYLGSEDHSAAAAAAGADGLEELKPSSSEKAQSTATSVVQKPRAPSPTLRIASETSRWKESITHLGRSGARVLGLQSAQDKLRALNYDRNISRAVRRRRRRGMRTRILLFLDEPKSSVASSIVFNLVVVLILISVGTVFVDSMPGIDEPTQVVVEVLEVVCSVVFSVEVLLRIFCTDSIISCSSDPFMWIDVLSVLPFALKYTIFQAVGSEVDLDFLRLVRLLRLLKLARHYEQSRVLLFTLKLSAEGLLVRGARGAAGDRALGGAATRCIQAATLCIPDDAPRRTWQVPLFFLMMGVVLFAGVLFYTEKGGARQEDFKDMWHASWFVIVTLNP